VCAPVRDFIVCFCLCAGLGDTTHGLHPNQGANADLQALILFESLCPGLGLGMGSEGHLAHVFQPSHSPFGEITNVGELIAVDTWMLAYML